MTLSEHVRDILRSGVVGRLTWSIPNSHYGLDAQHLGTIANRVESGDIPVIATGSLVTHCLYRRDTNALAVPHAWGSVFGIGARALVVHESVHAVQDMKKRRLSVADDEIQAYVTQALYLRKVTDSPSPPPTPTASFETQLVIGSAYAAACAIHDQRAGYFTPEIIADFKRYILALPEYPLNSFREYDGF